MPENDSTLEALRLGSVKSERRTLTAQAYDALRQALAEVPIYDGRHDGHLDERALAERLGMSRTPVREALLRLQSEGMVRMVPRRGIYLVRKKKGELIDVILASAALESMAARLAATRASDDELQALRTRFLPVDVGGSPLGRGRVDPVRTRLGSELPIDEYSDLNVTFHQHIVDLARSELFSQEVARLRVHMRAVRHSTMGHAGRLTRSIVDHTHIIEALESRQPDLAERYVRQHAIDLADHVRVHLPDLE